MPKTAKLKSVLTLDNSQFVKGIKESIKFAKDLSKQFAAAPIRTTFLAGILSARAGIKGTAAALQSMGRVAVDTLKIAAGAGAAVALTMTAISVKAISAAAQIEDLTTGFKVLLHSETAATDRMKELVNFAAHTPYMLPQVAAASRTLEVLTHGMLSTGKGLQMVGDIASATNRDFEETAVTVGRLFAALRSGTAPGEALASLQDAGAISPEARRKISGMATIDPGKAWMIAQQELNRFSGMMEQKSHTWNGLMSTFHDSILNAFAVFGKPLIDTLKPALDQLTQVVFLAAPEIADMGTKFAAGINLGVGALEETLFHPDKLIEPLTLGLRVGFLEAGNLLIAGIKTAAGIMPEIAGSFKDAFIGASLIIGGKLMEAFKGPMAFVEATMEKALAMWNTISAPAGAKGFAEFKRDSEMTKLEGLVNERIATKRAGGDTTTLDHKIKQSRMRVDQASAELAQYDTGPSVAERQQRIMQSGSVGENAKAQIEEGGKLMAQAMTSAMDAIEGAAQAFKIEDVTGAGDAMTAFLEAIKKLAEKGKRDVASAIQAQQMASGALTPDQEKAKKQSEQRAAAAATRMQSILNPLGDSGGITGGSNVTGVGGDPFKTGFFNPKGFPSYFGIESNLVKRDFSTGKGSTGEFGLGGTSLDIPAHRTINSLLPLGMRRRAARYARVNEIAQDYMTSGSFDERKGGREGLLGSVRRGDRAAAMQFIRGKEKEQQENEKQQAQQKGFESAFDKGMAKYWGKGS